MSTETSTMTSARRLDAARQLLKPQQFRESVALSRQPSIRNSSLAGLQSAATAVIALPLVYLSPWSHLIGFASLGALVALFGRFAPQARRNHVVLLCAICQTLAVLSMSLVAAAGAPLAVQLMLLAVLCGVFCFVTTTGKFGPPGALIFIFAAGASMSQSVTVHQTAERTAATALVAILAFLVCVLTEYFRHQASPEKPFPSEALRPIRHRLIAAVRVAFGAGVAAFAAYAMDVAHPAWAAMGAVAVMQGAHLHINMNRALQRMVGTLLGAVVAWMILTQAPSIWTLIAILGLLQFATEVIIGSNYALGQILVTPMALLMTYIAAPGLNGADMVSERVLDTLLGAAIGIVFSVLFSTQDDRVYLAEHHIKRTQR